MSEIGSDDWMAAYTAAHDVELGAETLSISYAIEKTPAGKVSWTERWQDGRLGSVEPKAAKDADVAFTLKWPDYLKYLASEASPSALFMQGRLKMSGDMRALFRLLPVLDSDVWTAARRSVAAATDSD